jgi:hypothetical protein
VSGVVLRTSVVTNKRNRAWHLFNTIDDGFCGWCCPQQPTAESGTNRTTGNVCCPVAIGVKPDMDWVGTDPENDRD